MLISDAFLFPLLAAFCGAASRVLYRRLALHDCEPGAVLQCVCLISWILVSIGFGVPQLLLLSGEAIFLLLAVGILWVVISDLDFRSCRYLTASQGAVFDALSVVLVALTAALLFREELVGFRLLGIGLVALSVLAHIEPTRAKGNFGVGLKLASVVLMALALSVDKLLTAIVSTGDILFFGFLIPALLHVLLRPRSLRLIPRSIVQSSGGLLLLPILSVGRLYFTLLALSAGGLVLTYALLQMELVFVHFYELWTKRDIAHNHRRLYASLACMLGAVMLRL